MALPSAAIMSWLSIFMFNTLYTLSRMIVLVIH